MEIKNKKGLEMAFNTIVTIILALILLAIIIVFFTGGFAKFKDKIDSFISSSNVDVVIQNCNRLVTQESYFDYCCANKTIKLSSKLKYDMPCISASNYSWGNNIEKLNCDNIC